MRLRLRLLAILLSFCCLTSGYAYSQAMTWKHTFAAQAKAVAFNPRSKGQILYTASDDSSGIFKSYDGGMTWVHIEGGPSPITSGAAYVRQFLVLSADTSVLFA